LKEIQLDQDRSRWRPRANTLWIFGLRK